MKEEPKFVISGEIEQDNPKDLRSEKKTGPGGVLVFFIVFSILASLYIIYLHVGIHQRKQQEKKQQQEMAKVDSLSLELNNASIKIDSLLIEQIKLQKANDLLAENALDADAPGVFFEVQIGSFTDFNVDRYLEELSALRQEKYDGKTKLILGRFRSLKTALLFENDMKRLGLREAFIVGRIDGTLVDYNVALEEQKKRDKQ